MTPLAIHQRPGGAHASPDAPAVVDGRRPWHARELALEARLLSERLGAEGTRVIATLLDNSVAWIVADLAAAQAGAVHVPLPLFFTVAQIQHAFRQAGVDTVLMSLDQVANWPHFAFSACTVAGTRLALVRLPAVSVRMPIGTSKVTFTSGTTGTPKGVCLGAAAMRRVADGLVDALAPLDVQRHLCALPFAVLLENIAGLMAPMSTGATCIVAPLAELGMAGSSRFDAARFDAAVERHQPHSLILMPQMLRAWQAHLAQTGKRAAPSLRLVAVGGAAVGAAVIDAARRCGIPAYEGYGLSEGASVQTLNLPGADRPGSAGRALPHARIRIAADGEILVGNSGFLGYLGDDGPTPAWWPTGDLGRVDDDGFVFIEGRRRNVLITAYGRNVSPEWIERTLGDCPGIAQAVVVGDGQPHLGAVLWPSDGSTADARLAAAVDAANAALPDYAQVRRWTRALAPLDASTGLATANGRPRRHAIARVHAAALGMADAADACAFDLPRVTAAAS